MTSNGALIFLMAFLFLFLGYMGVPVAFALIASVLVVTAFTPVSLASMMAQLFNGMDVEALLAVPFFRKRAFLPTYRPGSGGGVMPAHERSF